MGAHKNERKGGGWDGAWCGVLGKPIVGDFRQILYTEQKRGRRVSYPACLSPTWDRNGMIGKARCSGIWCFFAYEFIFFVMFAF